MRRVLLVVLALLALAALIVGGLYALGRGPFAAPAPARRGPPLTTVAAAPAELELWRERLETVGTVTAVQGVTVSPEVPGVVASLHFRSGERVEAGQLLVRLDEAVDRAHLQALRAQARLAETDLRRQRGLVDERIVSQAELETAQSTLDVARAQVAEQEAQLDKKRIVAPFAGRLGLRQVDVGQYLQPGQPIVDLQALDPIQVRMELPEEQLASLRPGLTVEVESEAWPGRTFTGRITAVAPALSRTTRGVELEATLPNPDAALRPGLFVSARVLLPAQRAQVTLPRTALVSNPYGDAVWLVRPPARPGAPLTVRRQYVTPGPVRGERLALRTGVLPGWVVVTSGQLKLQEGAPVRLSREDVLAPFVERPVPEGP